MQVDVYGFAPWHDPSFSTNGTLSAPNEKYHYFDAAEPRPGSHSFDLALYTYKLFANHLDTVRVIE